MNPEDRRLTAYLVDELTPEEREAVEAALLRDRELAFEAREMDQLVADLRCQLQAEEAPPLTEAQHAVILAEFSPALVTAGPGDGWYRGWALAAAACVVLGLSSTFFFQARQVEDLQADGVVKESQERHFSIRYIEENSELAARSEGPADLPETDAKAIAGSTSVPAGKTPRHATSVEPELRLAVPLSLPDPLAHRFDLSAPLAVTREEQSLQVDPSTVPFQGQMPEKPGQKEKMKVRIGGPRTSNAGAPTPSPEPQPNSGR
jgi:hypothetical protein